MNAMPPVARRDSFVMTSASHDSLVADAFAWQSATANGTNNSAMKIILITPGTGSYYCGVCMRDNALAKELIRQGHEALMLPLYLPLQLDEAPVPGDAPTFFGGVNVFLQERFSIFRHTPTWFDWIFDRPFLLRRLAGGAQDAHREIVGRMTCSMLEGEHGHQRKELRRLINWLKKHQKPDAIWLSTMLLTGFARQLKKEIGVPVLASLQGEDEFLDGLPKPWNRRAWEIIIERSNDVDLFVAPSRFYATLMCGRMRLRRAGAAAEAASHRLSRAHAQGEGPEFRGSSVPDAQETSGIREREIAHCGLDDRG